MIRYAALLFGLVIVSLGLLGLAAPDMFLAAIRFFQSGHLIYVAAAVRIFFGVIIIAAGSESRWPRAMRVMGAAVVLLGLLTPVSLHPIPSVAWGWWPGSFVKPWALSALLLGGFVVAASVPPRDIDD